MFVAWLLYQGKSWAPIEELTELAALREAFQVASHLPKIQGKRVAIPPAWPPPGVPCFELRSRDGWLVRVVEEVSPALQSSPQPVEPQAVQRADRPSCGRPPLAAGREVARARARVASLAAAALPSRSGPGGDRRVL
jgi:hypothetical protein